MCYEILILGGLTLPENAAVHRQAGSLELGGLDVFLHQLRGHADHVLALPVLDLKPEKNKTFNSTSSTKEFQQVSKVGLDRSRHLNLDLDWS